jgi:hypothetical protein
MRSRILVERVQLVRIQTASGGGLATKSTPDQQRALTFRVDQLFCNQVILPDGRLI